MDLFLAVLQSLAVAAAAFMVLALLVSHLRYRKAHLLAEAEAEGRLSLASAVFLVLEKERHGEVSLLQVLPENEADLEMFIDVMRKAMRITDRVMRLENGSILVLVDSEPAKLPAVSARLVPLLREAGIKGGLVRLFVPDSNPGAVLGWLEEMGEGVGAENEWRRLPETWPYEEVEAEPSLLVDPLTGVLKSERVAQALRRLMAVYRRRNQPLTLMRLDVDHLEDYNREHGREAGDAVLRQVGKLLMRYCRETDLIGRVEEDEFVLCLPGPVEDMPGVGARLCAVVKDTPLEVNDLSLRCTVSCGMAAMPGHGQSPNALFERAGLALEAAKKRGRGSCRMFDPQMQVASSRGPKRPEAPSGDFL